MNELVNFLVIFKLIADLFLFVITLFNVSNVELKGCDRCFNV